MRNALIKLFLDVHQQDMVVVVAAGQKVDATDRGREVSKLFPQSLGDLATNFLPLINVGGVDATGNPPSAAYTDVDGRYISVYASWNAQCLDVTYTPWSPGGTSLAAPAVSGVLAQWLSMPVIVAAITQRAESNFPAKVRGFLRDTSLTTNYPGSSTLNILYNGFRDNPCYYDQADRALLKDRDDGSAIPVIVDGTIVQAAYYNAVCATQCLCAEQGLD